MEAIQPRNLACEGEHKYEREWMSVWRISVDILAVLRYSLCKDHQFVEILSQHLLWAPTSILSCH